MERTVADTIRDITREHLEKQNGMLLGQCVTAVGWVQNTVPPGAPNIVELSMTEVSGAGMAVGAALVGRRPIFVVRFQGYFWLAGSPIVNHAARAKELFGYGCPLFVRAIAAEGGGIGAVSSGAFHNLFMNVPGITVVAPMTPREYEEIWAHFMKHDDPMFVSEHRRSYGSKTELEDVRVESPRVSIFAISASRFNAVEAVASLEKQGIRCDLFHVNWLKPLGVKKEWLESLKRSGRGLVLDSGFEPAGASQSVAYELMHRTGARVTAMALEDRSSGAIPELENVSPSAGDIEGAVRQIAA